MSPRTANRAYFCCACAIGPNKRHHGCSAKKFHPTAELEERVWSAVSTLLTDPENLRVGHLHPSERRTLRVKYSIPHEV